MTHSVEETFPSYKAKQAIIDVAWEHCELRLQSLPLPLRELSAQFLDTIADASGSHRSYFSSPFAPPLLYMPLWLADGLSKDRAVAARLDPSVLARVLAATMHGYIGIRLQDDVLDEPTRSNPNLLLLGNTCFSYMVVELAAVLATRGEHAWPAFDQAIVDFSHLTLAEQHAVLYDEQYGAERFEAHADKVAFARIPLLIVAAIADRMDCAHGIQHLVHQLGIAYGIANDVLGWSRDVRCGHRTWLLARAGFTRETWEALQRVPEGAQRDAASAEFLERLRTDLYEKRLLREAITRAIEVHRSAQETAQNIGLVGFDDFTHDRIAWLEGLDRQTSLLTLQRLLHKQRG